MNVSHPIHQMEIKDLADLYGEELHIKSLARIRGSPRAREIAKRFTLDEKDGRIIDEHDQFYRDHKLLLLLFRVLGVMPVERGEIGRITFSWTSKPMMYAYVFYIITTVLVVLVGYERIDILLNRSKRFDEYIYAIIFILYLIPHFFIPYMGWSVAYEVCDYKNSWGRFQLNYYKITGRDLEFPYLSTLIRIISLGCLFIAIGFLLTLSALLEGFTLYHTTAYLHIITMINMNCALWYINCRAIGNASTGVADSFKKDIEQYCGAYIIKHYRMLWLELSEVLQNLGNAYARTYSAYSLLMMANLTISVYGFISEIVDHGLRFTFKEMGLLVDAVYCFILLFIFCDCSHNASENIAERVQWSLMEINLNQVDQSTVKEVQLFLKAIHLNPPKVSLGGYTVVNRELMTSIRDALANLEFINSGDVDIVVVGDCWGHFLKSFCGILQGDNLAAWKSLRLRSGSRRIYFCSDSKAALMVLKAMDMRSLLVKECKGVPLTIPYQDYRWQLICLIIFKMNVSHPIHQMEIKDLADLYGEQLHIKSLARIRGSPRAREIAKRFTLDENDGRIIDKHDQFYRDHKLLLLLFKVMGVMPVERGEIGKITFSWTSKAMMYAYVFYIITTVLVVLVGYERIDILLNRSKKFDEYIYAIIFIIYMIPHFFIPFMGWSVAYEVCDYKNSWARFQLNYYKITGRDLEFPYLSTLIGTISLGCLFMAIGFLLTLSALLEGFSLYHTTAYLHIITMINMNCAMWYINCRALGNASTGVADSFKKDIKQYCAAYIIKHYRILWLELSDILQKLGNAYARTYSTYSLLMMANLIISVYGFISEIVDQGLRFTFKEMGLLVDAVYCFILLFVFCDCSHNGSENIAERVQRSLMEINLNQVDQSTVSEVQLFLKAIHLNPPKVSLRGYTVVNRELMTSSIATIAIYLIVLLQFKISLVNLKG